MKKSDKNSQNSLSDVCILIISVIVTIFLYYLMTYGFIVFWRHFFGQDQHNCFTTFIFMAGMAAPFFISAFAVYIISNVFTKYDKEISLKNRLTKEIKKSFLFSIYNKIASEIRYRFKKNNDYDSAAGASFHTPGMGARITPYLKHIFQFHLGLCTKPWFEIESPDFQKLTLHNERIDPVETDTVNGVKLIQSDSFKPLNNFIIYQHRGPEIISENSDRCRVYQYLDKSSAQKIAETIKGGPVRNIFFLFTTFETGAIQVFTDTLMNKETHTLNTLGLFWLFSSDDITDKTEDLHEIIYAANNLQIRKLTILTAEFNEKCEIILAEGLKENKFIEDVGIFKKDNDCKWPRFPIPNIDLITGANRKNENSFQTAL